MTTQTTKEFDKLRAQVEKKLAAKVKPKMVKLKIGWRLEAPDGYVVRAFPYGEFYSVQLYKKESGQPMGADE